MLAALILSTTICLGQTDLKCFKVEEYRLFLIRLQQGKDAADSLLAYKLLLQSTETALKAKQHELLEKDNVLSLEKERSLNCEQQKKDAMAIIGSKDVIISTQENTIKRLGSKPKYWSLGIGVGYGYLFSSTIQGGPVFALTVSRSLFKF